MKGHSLLVLISLFENIRSQVIGTNASVCLNTRAVLTCTTVTASGVLKWLDSVGTPATYNPQDTIGSTRTLDEFYLITLSNITTTTEGRVYTSTATTAVPVNISHNGTGLRCTDDVNVTTISIQIKETISSPLNLKCSVSSCMDTECTVTCTWDPPNDTPLCVSEYIIRNELDNAQLSAVQGHITCATFPVNKFTNYALVVVANNFHFSQSNSSEYHLHTFKPQFEKNVDFVLPNSIQMNSAHDVNTVTTLLISWEYIPNRPPVTDQSISIDGYTCTIPTFSRIKRFNVTRIQTYSITFVARNIIGNYSITRNISVPQSEIEVRLNETTRNITSIVLVERPFGIVDGVLTAIASVFAGVCAILTILTCVMYRQKMKTRA